MDSDVLISCLCVTENRAPFMPWLLWCYDRQTWRNKELIVIESSPEPFACSRADVRSVRVPFGTSIMAKRATALREMRGQVLAWFDDDDWQHPERLERIAGAMNEGARIAGVAHGWFIDLSRGTCCRHVEPDHLLLFNAAGYAGQLARSAESIRYFSGQGSETDWSGWFQRTSGAEVALLEAPALTALLCHTHNVLNRPSRWALEDSLEAFRTEVGERAWRDTSEQLVALQERLRERPLPCQGVPGLVPITTSNALADRGARRRRNPYCRV